MIHDNKHLIEKKEGINSKFPSFFPKVNYGNSFWTFINVQFYFQLFQIGKNTLKTRHSNSSMEFYRILV
jgi:hypothetical protein